MWVRAIALVLPLFAGCAAMQGPGCGAGQRAMTNDLLYFGTQKPGGVVSAAEWADFLATSATPRFPDGLTTWDAAGQWKSAEGTPVREASHVLNVVHEDSAANDAAVAAIAGEYKARFRQESVLRVSTKSCVSF